MSFQVFADHLRPKGKYLLPISDLVDQLNLVLRRSETCPIETDPETKKIIDQKSQFLQKNYTKIVNCISIVHQSINKTIPEITDLYGENPLIQCIKLPDGKISIEFKKTS